MDSALTRTADVSHLNSAVIRNGCVSTQYADCARTDVVHDVLSRIKLAAVYCVSAVVADAACGDVGNRTLLACRADAECGLRGVACKVAESQTTNGGRGRLDGCFSRGIGTQCDRTCMSGIGVFTESDGIADRGFCRIAQGKGVACGGFGIFTEGYGTVLRGLGVVADGDGVVFLRVCFVTQCQSIVGSGFAVATCRDSTGSGCAGIEAQRGRTCRRGLAVCADCGGGILVGDCAVTDRYAGFAQCFGRLTACEGVLTVGVGRLTDGGSVGAAGFGVRTDGNGAFTFGRAVDGCDRGSILVDRGVFTNGDRVGNHRLRACTDGYGKIARSLGIRTCRQGIQSGRTVIIVIASGIGGRLNAVKMAGAAAA